MRAYGPWLTIVGVIMRPPFNNPNVDDSGFSVPLYAAPFGPAAPGRRATRVDPLVALRAE